MKESLIAIVLAVTLEACVPVCANMQTRCNGSYVELCDGQGQWQRVMTCDDVAGGDEPWVCCMADVGEDGESGHTCVPESECGGDER